jgi:membrane protease YdiL (CAAX protease family)
LSEIELTSAEVIEAQKNCTQCNEPIAIESRFCRHCGFAQLSNAPASDKKWADIKLIAIFFVTDAGICAIANFVHFFHTLTWSIIIDASLAVIATSFFFDNRTLSRTVLLWHRFSIAKLLGYCVIAFVASILVSYTVEWLNRSLFSEEFSYYQVYAGHSYSIALTILFVAVMPALFEELAYRGFVLGKLLHVVDKKQAVFISSFLFAIMHMSFISLFWLVPFALWLGYLRVKENTLWYGVCIHFTFNFTACMIEILRFKHS